jgi:hypothetical protein
MNTRLVGLITIAGSVIAIGAPQPGRVQAQSLDATYKGSLECEQVPPGIGSVRTPLAIIVHSGRALASAPIFDVNGRHEISDAVATGTLDGDGVLRLAHVVFTHDASFQGEYTGMINATGGTLTGTQVWTRSAGGVVTRTCKGNVYEVKAPRQ